VSTTPIAIGATTYEYLSISFFAMSGYFLRFRI
jgi:hypothetical protein